MNTIKHTNTETISALREYSLLEKLQLLCALFFVGTLTLDQKLNSFALVLFLFLLLFSIRFSNFRLYKWPILIFTMSFIVSAFSLMYSSNQEEGKHVIERQLSLFLFPLLCFSAFRLDGIKFHIVIKFFYISIVLVALYLLKCSAEKFLESQLVIKDWFVKDNLYHSFARPIQMHATYLSLYVAMAIFIGFYWFLLNNAWWIKVLVFFSALMLVVALTMLSSRIVISSVFVMLFLVYPFHIGRLKYKLLLVPVGAIVLLLFFLLIRESSFITDRFVDKIKDEIRLTNFLHPDSTYNPVYGGENRADRWFCAIELIKEKPLQGYGTGSEKDVLMEKYQKYNLQNAVLNNYDAHNQYLAYTIKSGIIGLLCFLATIAYGLYISLKRKSFIYLSFMLLFAVTCITENVLESNKGIFFFAFFNTLLCYSCFLKEKGSETARKPK